MRLRAAIVIVGAGALACARSLQACAPFAPDDCASHHDCPADVDAEADADAQASDVVVADAADGTVDTGGGDGAVPDSGAPGDSSGDAMEADTFVCPASAEPKDQPCVVDEAYGVFVSPTGSATGVGTRTSPLKSIDTAITLAKSAGDAGAPKRVYACGGTYGEAIAIDATRDGVQVFGGLRCSDWSYDGEKAIVAPSSAGVALTLTSLTSARFVDVEIDAQDAVGAGASSIAAFVTGSQGVAFERVGFHAGAATVVGAAGAPPIIALPTPSDGTPAADGGAPVTCNCQNSGLSTTGGQGGTAGAMPTGGGPGLPALDGGAGGTPGSALISCTIGGRGGDAPAAPAGAGAATYGALSATAWTPADGEPGSAGDPGQGGGGGGAESAGGGGGGGCGGCGGSGATPGRGGGSSIALAVYQSQVTLTASALVAKTAAPGGAGALGQAGAVGGGRGAALGVAGCPGGFGGTGGAGGSSGGGAGGLSLGILYQSATPPTLDQATQAAITVGTGGAGGQGGNPGSNDGKAGVAQATLAP